MKKVSAATTVSTLMQGCIQYYDVTSTVTTNWYPQFTSQVWKELMVFLGTKHITTTNCHPESNGILEIVHVN